jgi:hypothetical protein
VTRRNLLLAVLLALLTIVVVDHWPGAEVEPAIDPSTLTVEQLLEQLTAENRMDCWHELQTRGWRDGPEALMAGLKHADPEVRGMLVFLGVPSKVDAAMAARWETQLLTMLAKDPDLSVRTQCTYQLAMMVRDGHLDEVPPALLDTLRSMLAVENNGVRFQACTSILWLADKATPLREDLLAMDVEPGEGATGVRVFTCQALGFFGVADKQSDHYLLKALHDQDPTVRTAAIGAIGELDSRSLHPTMRLTYLLQNQGQPSEVRAAALASLARLSNAKEHAAAQLLHTALQAASWFPSTGKPRWVTAVANLAMHANDESQQRAAIEVLRQAAREEGLRDDSIAVPAAIARIAVALRDESLLQEVLPPLLDGMRDVVEGFESGMFLRKGMLPREDSSQLMCEALVDVCLWHQDLALSKTVAAVLRSIEGHKESWLRKWARTLLARLQK